VCEAEIPPRRLDVVRARLHPHQQRVEARDVHTGGIVARLERLHEGRPRAGKRIEDATAGWNVAPEQRLDELRNELPQIRVEPMDEPRALAFRQLALGPQQRQVEPAVQHLLRDRHPALVRRRTKRS
jgi:hypothetical protein